MAGKSKTGALRAIGRRLVDSGDDDLEGGRAGRRWCRVCGRPVRSSWGDVCSRPSCHARELARWDD